MSLAAIPPELRDWVDLSSERRPAESQFTHRLCLPTRRCRCARPINDRLDERCLKCGRQARW